MAVKAIQLLMNEGLPEDLRDYSRSYDSKSIKELMTAAANNHPDEYADIVKHIMDVGRISAYRTGQTSKLSDYKPVFDRSKLFNAMDKEVAAVKSTIKNKEKQLDALRKIYEKYTLLMQNQTKAAVEASDYANNLFNAVKSGARGNLTQLNAMVTTPGVYTDFRDKSVPLFIRRSYAEGLTPAEFLSSTWGLRKSTVSIKRGTAQWGGLGKSINRPLATMVVTSNKSIDNNGIDYDIDDDSLYGRVLARDAGHVKAGTVLDRYALSQLKKQGVKTVIAKSPIATISADGIPADVAGLNTQKEIYKIGEHPGLKAGTALSEPLTQSNLCIYADTEVLMADKSVKKIKDIKPGDYVMGSDLNGNCSASKVINVYDQGLKHCYKWSLNNTEVVCTKDHKFLYKKYDSYGLDAIADINSAEIVEYAGKLPCFDLEIEHPDHLFVLANGLISHNSSKHTAGAFSGRKAYTGFKFMSAFLESPEEFPDRAAVSKIDGKITKIEDAPQGGKYIYIGYEPHYVLPGMEIFVKPGDKVERGEIMSDGLADVEDIIETRGLGEGRRYFVERFKKLSDDSNAKANKRNVELFARGFLDKVEVTNPDGMGDFLPGDIVSYNKLEANYVPEEDSKEYSVKDDSAKDKYLQRPVLHFTIGTKLTPKMIKKIRDTGISDTVLVSDKEPGFKPVMVRLREAAMKGETDWIGRATASYQKSNYIDAAVRGLKSNLKENYNPFTRLSQPDFAEKIEETGKF